MVMAEQAHRFQEEGNVCGGHAGTRSKGLYRWDCRLALVRAASGEEAGELCTHHVRLAIDGDHANGNVTTTAAAAAAAAARKLGFGGSGRCGAQLDARGRKRQQGAVAKG